MHHYVTLFDTSYAAKGLSLWKSLMEHSSEDFILWILPLRRDTEKLLQKMQDNRFLSNIKIIKPDVFFTDELVAISNDGRGWAGFCWTMASVFTKYVQDIVKDTVTYLDSDVFFFNDPEIIHRRMSDCEVAVVDHNFPDHDYDRLIGNGRFNVSIVTFKYTSAARLTLTLWAEQCLIKCDNTNCGDQQYLDKWPDMLGELLHIHDGVGVGAGPWNAYTYSITPDEDKVTINGIQHLVAYHFHEYKKPGEYTGYPMDAQQVDYIYKPYDESITYFTKMIKLYA